MDLNSFKYSFGGKRAGCLFELEVRRNKFKIELIRRKLHTYCTILCIFDSRGLILSLANSTIPTPAPLSRYSM